MQSPEPPPPLVALQSRLTEPNRGLRYQLLRPLVVLRDVVEHAYRSVISMMVAELRGRGNQYTGGQHLTAFVFAAAFGIAAYYLAYLEGIVVGTFFGLWALDRLAHIHLGAWHHDRVITRITREQFRWRRHRGSELLGAEDLPTRSIREVTVAPVLLVADAFAGIGQQVWRVDVVTEDGALSIPVFEADKLPTALDRATTLARKLRLPTTILGSTGRGAYAADRSAMGYARLGAWDVQRSATGLTAARTPSPWRAFLMSLERNGILFFVVIMADVLARFGHLVMALLGPTFGIHDVAPLTMNLSPRGLLELITPEFSWIGLVEFCFATVMLGLGCVQNLRGQHLHVTERGARFTRGGKPALEFTSTGTGPIEALKLDVPKSMLVFADAEGRALAIDGLDEDAVAELFANADSWLRGEGRSHRSTATTPTPSVTARRPQRTLPSANSREP